MTGKKQRLFAGAAALCLGFGSLLPVFAKENSDGQAAADSYSETEQKAILEALYKNNEEAANQAIVKKAALRSGLPRESEDRLDGIDISHWQDDINLNAIDADFVICKATGGTRYVDPSFHQNMKTLEENGTLMGFYHFAHDGISRASAKEEAAHFYQTVRDYLGKGIPVLDYEAADLLSSGAGWAYDFVDTFYQLSGVRCMIYTGQWASNAIDWSLCAGEDYPLWVARYGTNERQDGYRENPDLNGTKTGYFENYWMHQYTSNGFIDGYPFNLDLDKFYGSKEEWMQLSDRDAKTVQMYRLYNPVSGEHFYTSSAHERAGLISYGWQDEEKAWIADRDGEMVYRLYNPNSGDHHYTLDANEYRYLTQAGWINEGIGWLASGQGKPVYRLYNPNALAGAHHFTMDENEAAQLANEGWIDEGIAWHSA